MKTVKVVGIMSGPRPDGNTAKLLRAALDGARERGAEVTEVSLCDCHIEYCRGCLACLQRGECPIKDDFQRVRDLLYEADGIILASPTYCGSCNAVMKNLFDRLGLYEVMTSRLGGKHIAAISTASSGSAARGTAKAMTSLAGNGVFLSSEVTGTMGRGFNRNTMPEEVSAAADQARKLGAALAYDIERGARHPLRNAIPRIINRLFVRPVFQRFICEGRGDATKAVYQSLLERRLVPEAR
jgi:multimeric flavodoxin WrbA